MAKNKWTKESILSITAQYNSKSELRKHRNDVYRAACRMKIYKEATSHMPENILVGNSPSNKKWNENVLKEEALKYAKRGDFFLNSPGAYNAARRLGILNEICHHMPKRVDKSAEKSPHFKWSEELLKQEVLKYKTKTEFARKSSGAYDAARNMGILNKLTEFMGNNYEKGVNRYNFKWTIEAVKAEALKYKTRLEFINKNPSVYSTACRLGILDETCHHMEKLLQNWDKMKLIQEALKYKARLEFKTKNYAAYTATCRLGILDEVCPHMIKSANVSLDEQFLFNLIKQEYPKTQKLRDRKANIEGKPHIKGFDIDIYIPELRKGIEFDGDYWHSVPGLKRSRECWPEEDIQNYHQIKDEYFKSKGIELLHISENFWLKDPNLCVQKCLDFLNNRISKP